MTTTRACAADCSVPFPGTPPLSRPSLPWRRPPVGTERSVTPAGLLAWLLSSGTSFCSCSGGCCFVAGIVVNVTHFSLTFFTQHQCFLRGWRCSLADGWNKICFTHTHIYTHIHNTHKLAHSHTQTRCVYILPTAYTHTCKRVCVRARDFPADT